MLLAVKHNEAVVKGKTCVCGSVKSILAIEYHKKTGNPIRVKRCMKCGRIK